MSEIKNIVLYKSRDGNIQLDVQLEEETIWLTSLEQVSCIWIQLLQKMHQLGKYEQLKERKTRNT